MLLRGYHNKSIDNFEHVSGGARSSRSKVAAPEAHGHQTSALATAPTGSPMAEHLSLKRGFVTLNPGFWWR